MSRVEQVVQSPSRRESDNALVRPCSSVVQVKVTSGLYLKEW